MEPVKLNNQPIGFLQRPPLTRTQMNRHHFCRLPLRARRRDVLATGVISVWTQRARSIDPFEPPKLVQLGLNLNNAHCKNSHTGLDCPSS